MSIRHLCPPTEACRRDFRRRPACRCAFWSATEAIGSAARTIRLSQETALKQTYRHPHLSVGDYARVQRIMIDDGIIFRESESSVVAFLEDDGRWWFVAIKATAAGELFLLNYNRTRCGQLRCTDHRFPWLLPKRMGALGGVETSPWITGCGRRPAFQLAQAPPLLYQNPQPASAHIGPFQYTHRFRISTLPPPRRTKCFARLFGKSFAIL